MLCIKTKDMSRVSACYLDHPANWKQVLFDSHEHKRHKGFNTWHTGRCTSDVKVLVKFSMRCVIGSYCINSSVIYCIHKRFYVPAITQWRIHLPESTKPVPVPCRKEKVMWCCLTGNCVLTPFIFSHICLFAYQT
uniref:Uncharacterized protein n=1 Tax=uncultured microorganism TaxID=358574 RepID=I2FJM1_9ZZZZ|nr:hypothetical protein [uncultured microorganism]